LHLDELGMGAATETYTKLKNISREEQDAFSAALHGRAAAAMKNGIFDGESCPSRCRSEGVTRS